MPGSNQSYFHKIMNNLSYVQKYVLVCLIFSISLIPLTYSFIQKHHDEIKLIESQLRGTIIIEHLQNIFRDSILHEIFTINFDPDNPEKRNSISSFNTKIDEEFKQLAAIYLNPTIIINDIDVHSPPSSPKTEEEKTSIEELEQAWNSLNRETSFEKSKSLHDQFVSNVRNEFLQIGETSKLFEGGRLISYYLVRVSLNILPEIQEDVGEIIETGLQILKNKTITPREQKKLAIAIGLIKVRSDRLQSTINQILSINNIDEKQAELLQEIKKLMDEFDHSTDSFIELTTKEIQDSKEFNYPIAEYEKHGLDVLNKAYKLWNVINKTTKHILIDLSNNLNHSFYLLLSLTFLLMILAFAIGLWITYEATSRLNEITQAADELKTGDLSIRVPVTYLDEIGHFAITFNSMAQRVDLINRQLKILLAATKSLANGELSARIPISKETDDEFKQVALTFNEMAEMFEIVISQLQKLALNLTASATEIASASKEQETIMIEQEATTKEISIAANEITATSKEFVKTMSDIHGVAAETSSLASTGRLGLSNMEDVMNQMVEASTNIASRLSVLNNKASNIKSVITTITNVADQTNLLSLNAAIEAEKAGEFGRSFSVIAREIRRLADQTAVASLDIEKIVAEIMTAVSSSVMGVDDFTQEIRMGVDQIRKVGEQLAKIIEQVQGLTERFETVNQGMQAQSAGAEQINDAIAQLSQTAQQTTESIQQFGKTIQQLDTASNEIRGVALRISKKQKERS